MTIEQHHDHSKIAHCPVCGKGLGCITVPAGGGMPRPWGEFLCEEGCGISGRIYLDPELTEGGDS